MQRTYIHNEGLVFDHEGRYMMYDAVANSLKSRPGLFSTLLTMGSYYGAYTAWYATPFVAKTMYIWEAAAAFMTIANIGGFFDRYQSIVRMYLLSNLSVARL